MNNREFFRLLHSTLRIIVVLTIILIGLISCSETTFVAPEFMPLEAPPITVTVDQLYAEYMADEKVAQAKYEGERLLFEQVKVDVVNSIFKTPNPDISQGLVQFKTHPEKVDIYIMTGHTKFRPRDSWVVFSIKEGCKVDIVGQVGGFESDVLIVEDCWIKVVEGEPGVVY